MSWDDHGTVGFMEQWQTFVFEGGGAALCISVKEQLSSGSSAAVTMPAGAIPEDVSFPAAIFAKHFGWFEKGAGVGSTTSSSSSAT
jgi:hypothetical protein